jgi:hypothetical protein
VNPVVFFPQKHKYLENYMEENMKNRVFTLALLSIIAATGVWAQNLPGIPGTNVSSIWSSPQSSTTEGRYRSNADDFIRPDNYTNVKFNKWFGMVAFLTEPGEYTQDAIATVGFATKVNNLYIGAFYGGNFWAGAPVNDYTEQKFTAPPAGGVADKTYNVYTNVGVSPLKAINNAALLFGFADMGFRLTYRTNHQSFNKNDIVIGTGFGPNVTYQLYKNYRAELGYIAPQIAWAMAKNLTDKGIRPYATLDLVFDRNYQKQETVGSDGTATGEKVVESVNHFDPSLALGLGGYTFHNKDGFRASFDFDYVLSLNIFDNEYSYEENGQYKTAKIKGTSSPATVPLIEQSKVTNLLTPSLSGQWGSDRLALRFKLNMVLGLDFEEKHNMKLDAANKPIYHTESQSFTVFTFRPDIRLALQYKIVPDRLTLNAGARIQAPAFTQRTTDLKSYDEGTLVESSKKHETTYNDNTGTGSRFASRFSLGATFNFTENVWVEAGTGVKDTWGEGAIDIFAPGGLFSFGNLMVGLKF